MAYFGPGIACVGSSGGHPSDGAWGARLWKGDGPAALMYGVEVVVVSACFVGDHDAGCWYVVVERGAGELFGDACCRIPCFGGGVVEHEDVDSPGIVGRKLNVR